ncbi:MAG TPA: DUF5655 domain-containing protein, partial [Verrucomicrobiota bacterium]|nr:DUF5655 domain-containing protein [Verrucomicrobiota bacterium]
QLANIQKKTGRSLSELADLVRRCGLTKHGEIRDFLKRELALGYGDANTLAHIAQKPATAAPAASADPGAVLDGIYAGARAALRPVHEAFMAAIAGWGGFEVAPKKGYVSLRRKKQFAMIGPATNTRVEVGLNVKGLPGTERLLAQPPGGMCQYKVKLTRPGEVDAELLGWVRHAYDSAG